MLESQIIILFYLLLPVSHKALQQSKKKSFEERFEELCAKPVEVNKRK